MEISCDPIIAGVQNRNHCPYCLWSRHVDWRTPGDRLAGCRAAMRPIGLTARPNRNKYAAERGGELMLIHACSGCDTIVLNRIAADDLTDVMLGLFEASWQDASAYGPACTRAGIVLLTAADTDLVYRRLFGHAHR